MRYIERLAWRQAWSYVLRRRREKLGLSQTAVAKRMGVERTIYVRYEASRHIPTWESMLALSAGLELPMPWLVERVTMRYKFLMEIEHDDGND